MKTDNNIIPPYRKKTLTREQQGKFVEAAYNLQQARFHLDEVSTQNLADILGISKQALQVQINKLRGEEV